MRILLVDDDDALREVLTQRLSVENYAIDTAKDGQQGWEHISTYDYDLVILDVVMPQLDGVNLCKHLRSQGHTVPILLLTSQDSHDAKLTGWEAGADDYVVKPFNEAELIARIRALLRRSHTNPLPILTWGELWLNTNTGDSLYGGRELSLTAKEYALLEMMLRDSQHVFSSEEILDSLWASEAFPAEATVRSHVRRLRNKLTAAGAPPDFIATAHGHGYYLKAIAGAAVAYPPSPPDIIVPQATDTDIPNTTPSPQPPAPLTEQQRQYQTLLNQTWQQHQANCLAKVGQLQSAVGDLAQNRLAATAQAEAYRLAHTLSGTLGTFGLHQAMQLSRQIEQEIHPDLYLESSQAQALSQLTTNLHRLISSTITLPLDDAPNASNHDQTVRIMVVDDDPIFLQTIFHQLQTSGFDVSTLDDPQQFWQTLETTSPDVLLLDVQMPQISGLELCEKLRTNPSWQKLPVMFLSIFGDAQTQHRAFSVGADDYLAKPITGQQLSNRIHQRLQRVRLLSG
ncbi:response regulator [filamentous cyanobacterium LEGE 11480]|uniref:Response regulator n=1 Tax=Romeriopsis navalis LEGE 11480 TaxID=2777977 RepID=A0A928VMF6_9CYAN|nr:response regulator [Romeriopsis navalis]MBE9029200.1 response regulator [Romeriopsis navalis LEGE 11480]